MTAVVVGTFDHKYDYTRRMFKQSFEELPVAFSDIKNLKGTLVSLQYNGSHAPAWILTGRWRISDSDVSNNDNSSLKFTANITMVGPNGIGEHKHRLINFKLLNLSFKWQLSHIKGNDIIYYIWNRSNRNFYTNFESANHNKNRKPSYHES